MFSAAAIAAVIGVSISVIASPASAAPHAEIFTPKQIDIDPGGAAPTKAWTYPEAAPAARVQSRAAAASAPGMYGGIGNLGKYSFQEFNVFGPDTVVGVNLGTGNLYIRTIERALNGPGVPATLQRVYNSNDDTSGDLGTWKTDLRLAGLGLASSSDSVNFFDGTGASGRFTKSGSSWTPPPGMGISLKQSGSDWIVTYNKSGDQLTFNSSGWLTKRTDRNGTGVAYGYNPGGQLIAITDATGKRIGIEYANGGSTIDTVFDSSYRLITYNTDPFSQTLTEAGSWRMTSDNAGRLSTLTLGGRTLTFTYNGGVRQIASVTLSESGNTFAKTSFAYGDGTTTITDPRGKTSSVTWDDQWRVTKTTDQIGRSRAQDWTPNSDVLTTTDNAGGIKEATYDSLNNQTTTKLPTGAGAQAVYSLNSECGSAQSGLPYLAKCQIDDAGNRTAMTYDSVGNLTKTANTTGSSNTTLRETTYEVAGGSRCGGYAGQVCSTKDGKGAMTSYTYTAGNLTKVTPPSPLGSTSYAYDTLGRATSVIDGTGATTKYAYDSDDNIVTETYANGQKITNTYDSFRGTKTQTDSGTATTITFARNALGLETKRQVATPSGSGLSASVVATYDPMGNLLTHNDGSLSLSYAYDAANQLVSVAEPAASCPADLDASATGCIRFAYDSNGTEIRRVMPYGAEQNIKRDAASRITRVTGTDKTGQPVVDIGYSFQNAGKDRSMVQTRTSYKEVGVTAGAVTSYAYDSNNRLTGATERSGSSVTASWAFSYDVNGNRLSQTRAGSTGASQGTISYGYNAVNELISATGSTSTWTYDKNGSLTQNGLTGAKSTYGDRTQVQANGSTTYASVGQGNTLQLRAGSVQKLDSALGNVRTSTMSVLRAPNGVALGYRAGGATHYFMNDMIGSVVGVVSATAQFEGGYSYTPYGETRSSSATSAISTNVYQYAGGEKEGPLYKFGARYYDPNLGRFTQVDPSGQESNPYLYSNANPINFSDTNGLLSAAGVIGAAAVAALTTLISGIFCAALPLIGCVAAGAVYGAIGGGISAGILAADSGASAAGVQSAFLRGAALGSIAGALRPFLSQIANAIVNATRG
ncbi:RHS repeat-associated core domain-containing protein [Curtobacterium sp. RHCKG23]|uniref:RHS repeat-associated core domain-containing protein n=1 Tax=Curtobacterium citri TaxID=3055139 RepID=A0ABT7T586_9MICO|nr:RHS repeat-associated core domain-containing protein [Curtobacterium citri]MDM7884736.1 RHS repeat-associated core domain-containing protein [Curtobacterium citri]